MVDKSRLASPGRQRVQVRAAKIKHSIDLTFATKQKMRMEDPWRIMS